MKKQWKSRILLFREFKFDLKMKLSLLLLFTVTFAMQANSTYSQGTKISLRMSNVTVAEVIDEIETKTEFKFIFNTKAVDLSRDVSIEVSNKTLKNVLNTLFKNRDTTFEIYDKKVLLKRNVNATANSATHITDNEIQVSISGVVLDETGNTIPGVNIIEKGTTNGTVSDFDGNYNLTVKGEEAVIVFSYLGFETQEVLVGNSTKINVTLKESAQGLEEVVVVGYGTQKKSQVIGAVDQVGEKTFSGRASANTTQALQGKSPS